MISYGVREPSLWSIRIVVVHVSVASFIYNVRNHPTGLDSKQTYIDTHPTCAVWCADVVLIAPIVFHSPSYRRISRSLGTARSGVIMIIIIAMLPRWLANVRAIEKVLTRISRLRDFARSWGKTPVRLVNRGHGYTCNLHFLTLLVNYAIHWNIHVLGPQIFVLSCWSTRWYYNQWHRKTANK